MRIGLQTRSTDNWYGRWGEDAYKKLKEHGFSCSDFNMCNTDSCFYTLPERESDEFLRKERWLAEQAGIEITQVHGPWRWPPKDDTVEDRQERMEKMKRSIRATAVLGCNNWVIHPIMPYGVEDSREGNAEKTWQENLSFMAELLSEAKKYDITICLENMPFTGFSLAKPQSILKFVDQMNDDHFKICLDTGHISVFPDLCVAEETRALGKQIRVLHVHDNHLGEDVHLLPYFGVIDWAAFAKALHEIGYTGSFSLETIPPKGLPDPIFEKLCITLREIAEYILTLGNQ